MLLSMTLLYAQAPTLGSFKARNGHPNATIVSSSGLSASSAFLLTDILYGKLDDNALQKKHNLTRNNDGLFVQAFVTLANGIDASALTPYGVSVKPSSIGDMLMVSIPLNSFAELAQSNLCTMIDAGTTAHTLLDNARNATNVNNIHNGVRLTQGYKGAGVVVGIIDIGFEYAHPTFYDSTGNTLRVKRVWDQKATTGTPPSGYNYGKEMTTTSSIVNARYSDNDETHGTHVAGIAAGCGGSNSSARQYRGMAPESDIVLVSSTLRTSGIYDGIEYIRAYAQSVGKPCVINMSIGNHLGPHDGTSTFDRVCDTLMSDYPRGLILVGAAGNEGSDRLHVTKTFTATDTMLYTIVEFNEGIAGASYVDIWGNVNGRFKSTLAIVDTTTGRFDDAGYYYYSSTSQTYSSSLTDNDNETVDFDVYTDSAYRYNHRPNIAFYIDNSNQTSARQKVVVVVNGRAGTTVHLWGNSCTFKSCGFSIVSAGNTDYTVGEIGGVGHSIVSVGSYTTRRTWTALNGNTYNPSCTVNDLSFFSSHGPTLDGRTKPDITAPGEWIVSSVNRFDNSYAGTSIPYDVYSYRFNNNAEYYATMRGTSMATPVVTGIIALWLQANPQLGIDSVLARMRSGAITDSYTGAIPATGSNLWGWGKINAYSGFNASSTPTTYTITAVSSDNSMGSVSGGGTYNAGTTITLTATPANGHRFVRWNDNSTVNPRTVTVSANATYTAYFQYNECSTVTTFPWEPEFEDGLTCWRNVDSDGDGHSWMHYRGVALSESYDCFNNTQAPYSPDNWLISRPLTLPANATLKWYDCSIARSPQDAAEHYTVYISTTGNSPSDFSTQLGSWTLSDTGWHNRTVSLASYAGQTVRIAFRHHNTTDMLALAISTVTISEPIPNYTITAQSANNTMGSVSGGGTYARGTSVTLTARANSGYRFVRWNDNNTSNPRTITVTADATYTAYFEPLQGIESIEGPEYTVSVNNASITISGIQGRGVKIFSIDGRELYCSSSIDPVVFDAPSSGIYLIRVGNDALRRVVVVK